MRIKVIAGSQINTYPQKAKSLVIFSNSILKI